MRQAANIFFLNSSLQLQEAAKPTFLVVIDHMIKQIFRLVPLQSPIAPRIRWVLVSPVIKSAIHEEWRRLWVMVMVVLNVTLAIGRPFRTENCCIPYLIQSH